MLGARVARTPDSLRRLFTVIFADDTTVLCRESSMLKVEEWVKDFFAQFGAVIHPGKTERLRAQPRRIPRPTVREFHARQHAPQLVPDAVVQAPVRAAAADPAGPCGVRRSPRRPVV